MSDVFLLQHDANFPPGRIVPVFRDFGIPCRTRKLHAGDEVPTDLDEVRVLVLLGGTARLGEGAPDYFEKELETVKRMVDADRTVLGIGLGAQLLAHAAGAKVYPLTKPAPKPGPQNTSSGTEAEPPPAELTPEFGWSPARFPFPGGTEPIVMGLMDGAPMFCWHRDTFDLPKLPPPPGFDPEKKGPPPPTGNALVSSTPTTKNAAFRFKTRLFGFQYHFEMTREGMDQVADAHAGGAGADAAAIKQQTAANYNRHQRLGDRVLRNFVQFLKAY